MKQLLFLVFAIISIELIAQDNLELNYYLPQNTNYNTNIPTPESVIGHKVGEWHITHDKLVEYMKKLAEVSDRISIENRGNTYEDRPIVLLKITSQENHKKYLRSGALHCH